MKVDAQNFHDAVFSKEGGLATEDRWEFGCWSLVEGVRNADITHLVNQSRERRRMGLRNTETIALHGFLKHTITALGPVYLPSKPLNATGLRQPQCNSLVTRDYSSFG